MPHAFRLCSIVAVQRIVGDSIMAHDSAARGSSVVEFSIVS